MELFKIICSNDVKEFEKLVNEAMNDGYILMEGNQVLIVNKEPTEYQFVRHLLHKDYFYHQKMAREHAELSVSLEFPQANRNALVKAHIIKREVEEQSYEEWRKMKKEK